MHVFCKNPRHTRQNAITEGDLECILTRNCEDTEQLRRIILESFVRILSLTVTKQKNRCTS